jgi:chromosome segregation ATPase
MSHCKESLDLRGPDLRELVRAIVSLTIRIEAMSAQLDRLTAEVSEIKTVADSAITLLNGLSAQIRALKDDPAKLEALANDLDAKGNELAAAVTANTPSE